jgi:undecaprenyl diphosphate synthase
LHKKGIRIRIIGDISKFDSDIEQGLRDVMVQTKNNTKITAVFALNYGGRDELVRAVTKIAQQNTQSHTHVFTRETISEHLDTSGIPDPDIIVRTGGEERLSGFLLWQSEYSELYFPKWYMPEFTKEKLDEVLDEYARRKRRFGV